MKKVYNINEICSLLTKATNGKIRSIDSISINGGPDISLWGGPITFKVEEGEE